MKAHLAWATAQKALKGNNEKVLCYLDKTVYPRILAQSELGLMTCMLPTPLPKYIPRDVLASALRHNHYEVEICNDQRGMDDYTFMVRWDKAKSPTSEIYGPLEPL